MVGKSARPITADVATNMVGVISVILVAPSMETLMPWTRDIPLTRNAERRSQQRGIRAEVMEVLLTHGSSTISHGCEVVFMDKRARRQARAALGRTIYAQLERALDAYLVIGDTGVIVTCAHRGKRKLSVA